MHDIRDASRLSEVRSLGLLDTPPEEVFDCFTRLAARFLDVPVALFTLVDKDRQFFKSQVGLPEPWASRRETPLSHSFCQHAVTSGEPLIIEDAREHPLVQNSPAILDLGVVAYAGIPLMTSEGEAIGSFCAIDNKPHSWTAEDLEVLRDLASGLMSEVRLRRDVSQRKMVQALLAAEKRVLEAISTGSALPAVLDTLVRSIEEQVPAMWCSVLLGDPKGDRLRVAAAPSLPQAFNAAIEGLEIRDGMGACAGAVLQGKPVIATDVTTDPQLRDIFPLLQEYGIQAVASVPILSSNAEALGTFGAYYREPREPDAHEMEILTRAARIASIAIERANIEGTLRERETHYRRLVETSPIGIYALDRAGRCTEINHALTEILDRSPEDLLGHSFVEVIAPEDLEEVARSFQQKIAGELDHTILECHLVRPSGERRLAQLHATVIRENGEILGTHGLVRDITEERKREGWMRLLTAALETLEEGVSITDETGRVLYSNAAHCGLLGYEPGCAPEGGVRAFLPDDAAREELDRILGQVREHGAWTGRVRRRRIDGRIIPMEMLVQRVEQGRQELLFTIVRDITEEVEREGQLRRAERLASIGTLISGVAHELNNPLSAVMNFAELMLLDERDQADQEALTIIQRESQRMAKIVSNLRQIARSTQEEVRERVAVDLNEVVRHVLTVHGYRLKTSNIKVREDLAEDLPRVLADRGALEQVVLNLVVNAEQAMASHHAEGRLILRTRASAKGAALHVVDNGPGIRTDQLERIWDPFYTTKAAGEGMGLGLSLVHSIVAEHGGEIRVDSQVGDGAAFRVDLPRAMEASPGAATAQAEHVPPPSLRVLVVDDEASVRMVMARYLERRGHVVDQAAEGAAALEMLDKASYDVVLSDVRMPGLGGEAMMEHLQATGLSHKVVFMTGDASGAGTRLERAGVPVLLKPIHLPELASAVEGIGGRVE